MPEIEGGLGRSWGASAGWLQPDLSGERSLPFFDKSALDFYALAEPIQAGLVVIDVVLEALESEVAAGGDVFREVVEVDGLGGGEIILIDSDLVEVGVGFDGSDIVREVVVIEVVEDAVFGEESFGVEAVGV